MSNEANGIVNQVGRGIVGLFKFLVRLLFVLVLAVALGAGIFYGISVGLPALDRAYIQPVRDNTAAIAALEAKATQSAESYAAQLETLQTRITELEVKSDSRQEAIALIESQLATLNPLVDAQADLAARLAEIEGTLEDLDTAIAALETASDERLSAIEEAIGAQADGLEAFEAAQAADPYPGDVLYNELQLLKIMTLLSRAQIYLAQADSATAAADLETARSIAAVLAGDAPDGETDLSALLLRLELALENLPDRPDRALTDIQGAWEDLLAQLDPAAPETDEESAGSDAAGTPAPTPTPTSTP